MSAVLREPFDLPQADPPQTAVPAGPDAERAAWAARVAAALQSPESVGLSNAPAGKLAWLSERFGLSPLEVDVLAVLWVCAFDAELRSRIAQRESLGGHFTVRSIAELLGHRPCVRLPASGPLLAWHMAAEHPLIDGNAVPVPDAALLAWLQGEPGLDAHLCGRAQWLPPAAALPDWPLDEAARGVAEHLRRGEAVRLHVVSDDMHSVRAFAAALGERLGQPVLWARAEAWPPEARAEAAVRLHRQAFLEGGLPGMARADAALSCPGSLAPYPVQILGGTGPAPAPVPGLHDLSWPLPEPDAAAREWLWRRACPACASWPAAQVADLALMHEASAGDIVQVAASDPATAEEAAQRLRERTRAELPPTVRRLDAVFGWDDLVLPDAVAERLHDLAFEARERARLWSQPEATRLFPYGRGLVALFAGPPGTGKTMAAQVIAAELGLDLLAVDLSAVVSKWVGETSQHLQQLLASAAARRSVLFFDEADALYGKRVDEVRDAQDRYANLDTSHLMTALEAYPGIVLMASNLKANIDSAFVRRIRHVIDFTKPDAAAREKLWAQATSALFGRQAEALRPALPRLATLEATGAAIKNAALSALFAARRNGTAPTLRLCAQMLARELAKEGAGLSAREIDALEPGA